jgi:predicted PurR-regulated permease PerM
VRDFLRRTIYNRSYVLDVLVAVLLVTTIFFLIGQRNLTEQLTNIARLNHSLNLQNNDILSRIKSCTDPSGACYVQNTQRTGEAVDSINQIVVLANACTDKPGEQTVAEVEKCVRQALKSH